MYQMTNGITDLTLLFADNLHVDCSRSKKTANFILRILYRVTFKIEHLELISLINN